MKLSTLLLIVIIAFLMNGCLIDRIKQRRMIANQMKIDKSAKSNELGSEVKEPVLYTPSNPTEEMYQIEPQKKSKKSSKKNVTKKKKSKKKRVYKKKKSNKKRVKKVTKEPYSIEKNEADPELLGPQTTLKSNPLAQK